MKKLFFALFAMTFLFAGASFAQEVAEPTEDGTYQDQPAVEDDAQMEDETTLETEQSAEDITASAQGQEVQFEQLPDAVKSAFEGSDYAMWQVQSVTEMAAAEGTESKMYEIAVTDGNTEETVTYNENGEQQ
jgi:hypothetical protein